MEHAAHFAAQGRSAIVREALEAFPGYWRALPRASYWLGFCDLAVDPAGALVHLQQAHRGCLAQGDAQGAFEAAAAAADAIVFQGASYDALATWMPMLESQAPAYLAERSTERICACCPACWRLSSTASRRTR